MSDERKQQIEQIQTLLAERRKVEQWLQGLVERRSSAPLHVVERVEADYRDKLAESQARLSSETGAVRALVSELDAVLAVQERAVTAKADERAESELRAAVGEYAAKEWDKLRAKLDAAVTALEAERDATRRELEAMRTLLDDAVPLMATARDAVAVSGTMATDPAPAEPHRKEPAAAAAPAHTGAGATSADAASTLPVDRALPDDEPVPFATAEDAQPPADTSLPPAVDELAFLRTVLGGSTPHESPTVNSARDAKAGARPASRTAGGSRPSTGSSKTVEPELFAVPDEPMPMSEDQARESGGFQRLSGSFGALGANTPRASEALKSLKCGECGTLNYPTEWYCERCGGELAAF